MKMRKVFIVAVFLVSALTFGQKKIDFQFDYAQFSYDSVSNYIEFYYSFPKDELKTTETSAGNFVNGLLKIQITDKSTGKDVVNKIWKIKQPVNPGDSTDAQHALVGVLGFKLGKGNYVAKVSGGDFADTSKTKTYTEKFKVNPFIGNKISLSHIELAKNIKNEGVNKKSIFYKNSYEVIPNPSIVFDPQNPVLFYYVELYNLLTAAKHGNLKMNVALVNSVGEVVYQRGGNVKPVSNALVKVGMINLTKFPTDSYNLLITLRDTTNDKGAISGKKFFLYNPKQKQNEVAKGNAPFIGSEYGVLSEDDCDLQFDEAKCIATGEEIDRYEKLTSLDAKRKFLYNFWKKRDPLPQTPENEFKEKFLKRLRYVNAHFGAFNKPGYKTDRGRVYLKYGPYDQIERYPSSSNRKPYQIWYYNSIEGGVYFIFGDLTGYSDYELLHSTKRGEIHDYDWQRRIIQN